MAKADLHVHSKYSAKPSEWILRKLDARESYTEPESIYRIAKKRGMDFVTITDHNQIDGALLLQQKHPLDVFTGIEATTFFPESDCMVHVLIYGITGAEFNEIQKIRKNIYDLRDYIKAHNLAYSISHPTYILNGRLTLRELEKLMLLFDVFEGINGSRNKKSNETWVHAVSTLSPARIGDLYKKYRIEPISGEPWKKAFTGGSDDHSGCYPASAFTQAEVRDPAGFINAIRSKNMRFAGNHCNFNRLTFAIFKGIYDYSKAVHKGASRPLMDCLVKVIYEEKPLSFIDKMRILAIRLHAKITQNPIEKCLADTLIVMSKTKTPGHPKRMGIIYDKITELSDTLIPRIFPALTGAIPSADAARVMRNLPLSIAGIFIAAPFLASMMHLYSNTNLIRELTGKYNSGLPFVKKTIWFTDTIGERNGISARISEIKCLANSKNIDFKIITSLSPEEAAGGLPEGVINVPLQYKLKLPDIENFMFRIPSLLTIMRVLDEFEPDEVCLFTPGPIGLIGLLASKFLNLNSVGIYHENLAAKVREITRDSAFESGIEHYLRWFFSITDKTIYPSDIEFDFQA